jgi:Ribonuclease G/E
MSRRLVISALPGETRAAWLEDGRLTDILIRRADRPSHLGDLYQGRVTKVDKALDAAFVELGLARPGLLPLSEAPRRRLSDGDAVVVRVLREAAGGKGLRLSARIMGPPPDLQQRARDSRPPTLLARGDDPLERMLAAGTPPDEIMVDDPATHAEIAARLGGGEDARGRLRLDLEPKPLFEREGLEAEIEALLAPRVALPSGGHLLIEPVRTLTAIDVNSGRHDSRGGANEQALAVNLKAVAEIARQLRLRALSGLIVVDFLALAEERARRKVAAALRTALKDDPEPARVFPMAPSGLLEMTRRRGRPALHELLTVPCGIGGGGRVKDPTTLAFEALRAARAEAAARPEAGIAITADPGVIAALESGAAAAARRVLEERLGRLLRLAAADVPPGEAARIVVE